MKQSRLFGILYELLEHGSAAAPALAEKFEVSVRTIYRDMDALSAAGVPVYALPGRGGGYALLDGQTISRSLLSGDEQERILLALQSLPPGPADRALLGKLSALFGRAADDWIMVDLTPWGSDGAQSERFSLLKEAILSRRALSFTYTAAGRAPETRRVFPARLAFKGQAWYLQGVCQARGAYRTFKLSRMAGLRLEEQTFAPLPAPPPLLPDEGAASLTRLTLRFSPAAAFRVYDEFFPAQIEPQADGCLLVRAAFPAEGWLDGYLLSFGSAVEVVEPQALRTRLAGLARETFRKHAKP